MAKYPPASRAMPAVICRSWLVSQSLNRTDRCHLRQRAESATVAACAGHFGLELGSRIGTRTGERGELIGGLALIGVGAAVAGGII